MKKIISRATLLLCLSFFITNSTSAQWLNLYGPVSLQKMIETTNGDLIACGSFSNSTTELNDGLVLRTDADGNELWRVTFPTDNNLNSSISNINETTEGDFLLTYSYLSVSNTRIFSIYKISSTGDLIWESPMGNLDGSEIASFFEVPATGDILIAAEKMENPLFTEDSVTTTLVLLDGNGNLIREKNYLSYDFCCDNRLNPRVLPIPDGYIMAIRDSIYRLDHTFASIWTQPSPGGEALDLIETEQGDFICAYITNESDVNVIRFDENGTISWNTSVDVRPLYFLKIVKKIDETFRIVYHQFDATSSDVSYQTLSNDGAIGEKVTLPPTFQIAKNVIQTNNHDLVFMGSTITFPSNNQNGLLIRTDCEITGFNDILTGQVYVDENFDCTYDSTEQLLPNYPIQLIHENGFVYYGMSDSSGQYLINVLSGSYQTSAIPQSIYEIPCTPEIVNLNLGNSTVIRNLSIQRIIECPQMTVSVGTPFLRRCFENTYHINYCNSGTIDANDAYVEIMLDSFTLYENSSIPPTSQTGSLLTFDLGDIATGDCNNFTITTTLSCEAELGQNHCISAHIYPDEICLANSTVWDGSSIQVASQCTEDSVRFFINNLGSGDMLAPSDYIVIQDEILFIQDEFQLNSGSSIQRAFPANGSTYRMEADQSNGHPGFSMPSATVEGCGEWPFATGFFGYFPQNDDDLFIDIDCQVNIGSYDPNDKSAFPVGFGEQQVIDPESMVEYKIRFQNTGTDTAFNVSIRDTLSSILDLTSLRMGAASHNYTWRLEDQGTLVVDFPNILLPDSTTNLEKSNGFFSFKIKINPVETLPYAYLKNKAAIYFDFNEPIITNEVRHLIDTNFVEIVLSTKNITVINNRVKVAPNPVRDQTTLTFPADSKFPLHLKLYSQDGRLVKTETINNLTAELDLEKFSAGIYFYGVYDDQGLWASGKLVVQ